jgi:hypothetical protein
MTKLLCGRVAIVDFVAPFSGEMLFATTAAVGLLPVNKFLARCWLRGVGYSSFERHAL